jgi:hypothetical protein
MKDDLDINELIAFEHVLKYFIQKGFSLDNLIVYIVMAKTICLCKYYNNEL